VIIVHLFIKSQAHLMVVSNVLLFSLEAGQRSKKSSLLLREIFMWLPPLPLQEVQL